MRAEEPHLDLCNKHCQKAFAFIQRSWPLLCVVSKNVTKYVASHHPKMPYKDCTTRLVHLINLVELGRKDEFKRGKEEKFDQKFLKLYSLSLNRSFQNCIDNSKSEYDQYTCKSIQNFVCSWLLLLFSSVHKPNGPVKNAQY